MKVRKVSFIKIRSVIIACIVLMLRVHPIGLGDDMVPEDKEDVQAHMEEFILDKAAEIERRRNAETENTVTPDEAIRPETDTSGKTLEDLVNEGYNPEFIVSPVLSGGIVTLDSSPKKGEIVRLVVYTKQIADGAEAKEITIAIPDVVGRTLDVKRYLCEGNSKFEVIDGTMYVTIPALGFDETATVYVDAEVLADVGDTINIQAYTSMLNSNSMYMAGTRLTVA